LQQTHLRSDRKDAQYPRRKSYQLSFSLFNLMKYFHLHALLFALRGLAANQKIKSLLALSTSINGLMKGLRISCLQVTILTVEMFMHFDGFEAFSIH
jgi:hypothetical protein